MTEPIAIPAKRRDSQHHESLHSPHTQEINAIKDHVDLYGWSSAAKKLYGHHAELQAYEKRELAEVSHGKTAGVQLADAWAAYPDNGWRPPMFQRPRQPEVPLRGCLKVKKEGEAKEAVDEKEPLEHEKNGQIVHRKVRTDAPGHDATPGTTKAKAPKLKNQKAATEQTPEKSVTKAELEADECAIASDSEDNIEPPPPPRRARGAAPTAQTSTRQQTGQHRAPAPPRQAPPQANQLAAAAPQLPPGFNEAVLLRRQEAAARRSRKELEDMTAYARRVTRIPVYLSPRHDDLSN
ncbi:hypothetical protein PFICI_01265 [Pestalotiopsis fici W106-1]|uniref:Uncharacterized protein n=1 Tax=Pestalotiopsis fici (strain W106-1 / CGMCC3.15140) TaxID=1229662 RepID=W3XPJ4_PESFW|nr:uncharacterized protein PFICI_01265 [Pestalotiopsis fici W106-1]ETS87437.1 hypothetical protein PFICI_01265 [Pestalotiopsis fici W106-1]